MIQSTADPRRRSVLLRAYDYSTAGAYFVTICAAHRECLFGEVAGGEMVLNQAGEIVSDEWLNTPAVRPDVWLDYFVVMPNHVHAIVMIVRNDRDASQRRGVWPYAPTNDRIRWKSPSRTLGAIIRGFKSAATKRINETQGTPGIPVWQRNYYERVIRNADEMNCIREYIALNPTQWADDENNPASRHVRATRWAAPTSATP